MENEVINKDLSAAPEIIKIAKGATVLFWGTIFWSGASYGFNIYIARVLGVDSYGIYSLGLTIFNIFASFSLLGLDYGVMRYVALYHGEKDQKKVKGTILSALGIVSVIGFLIGFLIFIFSTNISSNIFHQQELGKVLKLFSIAIPFFGLTSIFLYASQGFQVMKYRVYVINIWEPLGKLCLTALFFLFGLRLIGAVFSHIIALFFSSILAFFFLKRLFPLSHRDIKPVFETKRLISFSLPLLLSGLFQIGIKRADTLLLGYFKSSQDIGIYNAAFQSAILARIFLSSFNLIFSPIISDLYNRKEVEKLRNLFKVVTKWIFTFNLPLFFLTVFFAEDILSFFGEKFPAGATCLIILAFGQFINSSTGPVGYMIMMSGRTVLTFINTLLLFSSELILCFLLIPKYGILGAAVAIAVSISLVNIIRLLEVYLFLKMHPYKLYFFKPLIAGGISLVSLYFFAPFVSGISIQFIYVIAGALFFLIIYVACISLLGIDDEDRLILNKIKTYVSKRISYKA